MPADFQWWNSCCRCARVPLKCERTLGTAERGKQRRRPGSISLWVPRERVQWQQKWSANCRACSLGSFGTLPSVQVNLWVNSWSQGGPLCGGELTCKALLPDGNVWKRAVSVSKHCAIQHASRCRDVCAGGSIAGSKAIKTSIRHQCSDDELRGRNGWCVHSLALSCPGEAWWRTVVVSQQFSLLGSWSGKSLVQPQQQVHWAGQL